MSAPSAIPTVLYDSNGGLSNFSICLLLLYHLNVSQFCSKPHLKVGPMAIREPAIYFPVSCTGFASLGFHRAQEFSFDPSEHLDVNLHGLPDMGVFACDHGYWIV